MIRVPADLLEIIRRGGSVVVPSRQRAHALRLGYAAQQLAAGARAWNSPDVLCADTWIIREIERRAAVPGATLPRLLSPAEEWLLWRQCTAEATRDFELLNRSALAESLRRSSALAADYQLDLSTPIGSEAELLCRVQRMVQERCHAAGAATVHTLAMRLSTEQAASELTCAGFLQPSPRLRSMGATQRAAAAPLSDPGVVIAADEADELEVIAQWCKRQVTRQPEARLLVVLAGSQGARERLATLVQQAVDPRSWLAADTDAERGVVGIEGGLPLADLPLIGHALFTLRFLGGSGQDFVEVSQWLRAPYWAAPGERSLALLDLWLRERGQLVMDAQECVSALNGAPTALAAAARELAARIQSARQALANGTASPRVWSERFRNALQVLGWPGGRERGSHEQQTLLRLHELLDEFGQLAASARAVSRAEAIHWLSEWAARTAFRPADDDPIVTIAAPWADPVALYDGIWVAGLHSDTFPQPVQPDPFIPVGAQLAAGVPAAGSAARLAEARSLLAAWRACTRELVLSTPARAGDLELTPSPLLAQWEERIRSRADCAPSWLARRVHRPNLIERVDDSVGTPWPIQRPLPAGTRSLELQNLCPFRAYAELRLGSGALGAPEPGVATDVRGKLMHGALQLLWQELRDSRALAAHTPSSLEALIQRSVAGAAQRLLGPPETLSGGLHRSAVFERECRRACRLIKALCALESQRSAFTVQHTELETALSVSGARMNVRIDRVDVLEGGGRAILDYKTGRRAAADWYGERPSHPQLLTYLAALREDVVAMATVHLTAREVRFDGIARIDELLPKVKGVQDPSGDQSPEAWAARSLEWLALIERLAAQFLAGRAVADPKPGVCDYCQAVGLCRIADRGLEVIAEALAIDFEGGDELVGP